MRHLGLVDSLVKMRVNVCKRRLHHPMPILLHMHGTQHVGESTLTHSLHYRSVFECPLGKPSFARLAVPTVCDRRWPMGQHRGTSPTPWGCGQLGVCAMTWDVGTHETTHQPTHK